MDRQEIYQLLNKYKDGKCNAEEVSLLETWYIRQTQLYHTELSEDQITSDLEAVFKNLPLPVKRKLLWPRIAAAVVLFLVFFTGLWFYTNYKNDDHQIIVQKDLPPGSNKAFLTLANGKRIVLTDAVKGEIAIQNGVSIRKTADGQLLYSSVLPVDVPASNSTTELNVISTPRGGQYQVILPDGTNVWLNAASSLSFPPKFTGAERKVTLTGEAYFEVAKNKKVPFVVKTNLEEVTVLGTHFNINGYADEAEVKTTLLEGAVQVAAVGAVKTAVLKPGQQAILEAGSITVKKADVETEIAWKNGFFIFKDNDLKMVMRQLSRWYDLDVEFRGAVANETFNGKVYRNMTLNEVLDVLSFSKVKFKMEGKKMIISP